MTDIVSRATRRAFKESYVNYSVLREISNDFDDAIVARSELPLGQFESGARRELVARYYQSVDWTSLKEVRKVLNAFEALLNRLEDQNISSELERLKKYLERDGLIYRDRKIHFAPHTIVIEELDDKKMGVDLSQLRMSIDRIKDSIEGDPGLAIGSSKELVESCCKAILTKLSVPFSQDADIPELVRQVTKELNLVPADIPQSKKGSNSIKRVLGNLANIVQGVAELRNLYGTGHGKAPGQKGLSPRHARLCVGAASTLSQFLMETAVFKKGSFD